jgi:hypothetical protein
MPSKTEQDQKRKREKKDTKDEFSDIDSLCLAVAAAGGVLIQLVKDLPANQENREQGVRATWKTRKRKKEKGDKLDQRARKVGTESAQESLKLPEKENKNPSEQ